MTGGTANLIEDLFTTLHLRVLQVASTGNGQSAMPHLEGPEVVVRHLWLEVVPGVVELVGGRQQQVIDCLAYAFVSTVSMVG